MLDTQGPEIRTGSFVEKEVSLTAGATITVTVNEDWRNKQTADMLFLSYKSLPTSVKVGDSILIDDGNIELKVMELNPFGNKENILCQVGNSGVLSNKKGCNLPGAIVDLPAMSDKDRADIK